jgi:hypothetical protein
MIAGKQQTLLLAAALCMALVLGSAIPGQSQPITGTNQIAFSDFDTAIPNYDYGYYYSGGWPQSGQYTNGTYAVSRTYIDPLIDPTNGPTVMQYIFTNAPFYDLITTNPSAYYGTGFGGPQVWAFDPSVFNNSYLSNYLFEFDARVAGLDAGQTTANGEMQVQIFAGAKILQKNINFNPGSNWTHFSFTLEDGSFGDGTTYVGFTNGLASISSITFNVNLHMPHPQFGWDDYNVLLLDNIELSVVQFSGPPPPPPPTVPFLIVDWNMDDKPLWYTYGGYAWSQNTNVPTITYATNIADMPGFGIGGSNAWWIRMDNTNLAPPNTPDWGGGGTGGGGPADYSRFTSSSLSSYRISFDSRAEGLSSDLTTSCALQFFLDSTNGNLRLDFAVPASSNWTTHAYTLNQGNAGIGSKAAFATNYNTYTELRMQWQIENATSADWGFDSDNTLIIDNIKLERLDIGCPPLTVSVSGTNIVVTWSQPNTGTAKLQSANNFNGPYSDVAGASSPYQTPLAGAPRYFRTQWVPPP